MTHGDGKSADTYTFQRLENLGLLSDVIRSLRRESMNFKPRIYHTVRTLTLRLPLNYLIRHNRKSYPNFKVSLTFEVHLEMTSASVQGVSYELMSSTFFHSTFFLKLS